MRVSSLFFFFSSLSIFLNSIYFSSIALNFFSLSSSFFFAWKSLITTVVCWLQQMAFLTKIIPFLSLAFSYRCIIICLEWRCFEYDSRCFWRLTYSDGLTEISFWTRFLVRFFIMSYEAIDSRLLWWNERTEDKCELRERSERWVGWEELMRVNGFLFMRLRFFDGSNGSVIKGFRREAEFKDTLRTFFLSYEERPLGSYFWPKEIWVSKAFRSSCSISSLVRKF